jgi:uncharacterized membrane protein YphA (DoxX/SURF4 family)
MLDKLNKCEMFCKNALGPLSLRIVLAVVFIYHGLEKITPDNGHGSSWIIPKPEAFDFALQIAVSWGEVLLGGAALALGLLTRLTAAGGALVQFAAIYVQMHRTEFGSAKAAGWDFNLVLVGACLALVFLGGGTISLDRLIQWHRQAKKTAAAGKAEMDPPMPVGQS